MIEPMYAHVCERLGKAEELVAMLRYQKDQLERMGAVLPAGFALGDQSFNRRLHLSRLGEREIKDIAG